MERERLSPPPRRLMVETLEPHSHAANKMTSSEAIRRAGEWGDSVVRGLANCNRPEQLASASAAWFAWHYAEFVDQHWQGRLGRPSTNPICVARREIEAQQ